MFDILGMQINLSPDIVRHQWPKIKLSYEEIEHQLPGFGKIQYQYNIKDHPLGGFFAPNTSSNPLDDIFMEQKFRIEIDRKYFTRGVEYYPGIFSQTDNEQTLLSISDNIKRLTTAYEHCVSGLWVSSHDTTICAFLDYIRNYLLILLYANNSIIRYIDPVFSDFSSDIKKLIMEVDYLLYVALTEGVVGYFSYSNQLRAVIKDFLKQIKSSKARDTIINSRKLIRESREVDSLSHIFNMAELIANSYLPTDTMLVGLEYGGIELPFSVNAVRYHQGKSMQKIGLIHLSQYSSGAKYRYPSIEDLFLNKSRGEFLAAPHVVLLDDSVTTARSIDVFSNLVMQYKKTMSVGVIAFKSSHRYHHLTMEEHGCINPTVLQLMTVLCQANYARTYKKNSYTNSSGVFDISKYELHKALGLL